MIVPVPVGQSLLFPGLHYLAGIRGSGILRIFDVLHLRQYTHASGVLLATLFRSGRNIVVFLLGILTSITIFGALLFAIESPEHGFTSIPISMYRALISVSTLG
jgi:voltage-gated potassium channel